MELPPGFRFHPTDEELITHYLLQKAVDSSFSTIAISQVDINQVEPWELPWLAKMGEKEWYFFCLRDRKYPSGHRTNRATPAGYWKATGKDKEIFRGNALVGWKKTLVFYKGRAPHGEKSNWVSHEYRMEGNHGGENVPAPSRNDWVLTRVYQKTAGGQKVKLSELVRMDQGGNERGSAAMAPPVNPQPNNQDNHPVAMELGQACGLPSGGTVADDPEKIPEDSMDCLGNPIVSYYNYFPADAFAAAQVYCAPIQRGVDLGYPGLIPPQEPLPFGALTGNVEQNLDVEFVTGDYDMDMGNYVSGQEAGISVGLSNLEIENTFGFGDEEVPPYFDRTWG